MKNLLLHFLVLLITALTLPAEDLTYDSLNDSLSTYVQIKNPTKIKFWCDSISNYVNNNYTNLDSIYHIHFNTISLAYKRIGELEKYVNYFKKYVYLVGEVNGFESHEYARELTSLGAKEINANQKDSAEYHMRKSVEILSSRNDVSYSLLGRSYKNLGYFYDVYELPDSAKKYYFLSLDVYELMSDNLDADYGILLNNISYYYSIQNNLPKSLEFARKAIDFALSINDTSRLFLMYNNSAYLAAETGKYTDAVDYYDKAIAGIKRIKSRANSYEYYAISQNKAALLMSIGKLIESRNIYESIINDFIQFYSNRIGSSNTVESYAFLLSRIGDNHGATRYYDLALEIARNQQKDNTQNIVNTMLTYGSFLVKNDIPRGKTLLDSANFLVNQYYTKPNKFHYLSKIKLADYYFERRKFDECKNYLDSTYLTLQKINSNAHYYYIDVFRRYSDYYKKKNNYEKSKNYLLKADSISKIIFKKDNSVNIRIKYDLAKINLLLENYEDSYELFRESFANISELVNDYLGNFDIDNSENIFGSQLSYYYDEYLNLISSNDNLPRKFLSLGFENRLFAKGILLESQIINKSISSKLKNTNSNYNKYIELKKYIAKANNFSKNKIDKFSINIDSLKKEAKSLEVEIKNSEDYQEKFKILTPKLEDLLSLMNDDEALIDIFTLRNELNGIYNYYAFIMPKNQEITLVNLDIDEETLSKEHNHFLETFDDIKNAEQNSIYPILNEKLSKLFNKLDDISKIYISVDGTLNSINLNLLEDATNGYFVDIYDIRYLTNLKYLSNEKKIHSRTASLFGISEFRLDKNNFKEDDNFAFRNIANIDSTFRSFRFSNLPNAVREVQIIEEILLKNNYEVEKFIESEATEYNVKDLKSPGILHLVTHGKYIDDAEAEIYKDVKGSSKYLDNALLRSFLVLNQGKNKNENDVNLQNFDDGILTAMEAMYLDLSQTELVVISACESGSGKVKHGEGVYGLQRAFLHAGSNHIIMSLWKVLDQPTMEFMEKFYNGLAIGNYIAQAFREAQLYLKQKYPNPYIWAGFVLVEG